MSGGRSVYEPGDQVEFQSPGLRGIGWYQAVFVSDDVTSGLVRIRLPDMEEGGYIVVQVDKVRRLGRELPESHLSGMRAQDRPGWDEALAEAQRERWLRPLTVHGPLDTPAMQHNQELELDAVRVLQDRLAGPSARFDAETVLVSLGWPNVAIKLAKGERF